MIDTLLSTRRMLSKMIMNRKCSCALLFVKNFENTNRCNYFLSGTVGLIHKTRLDITARAHGTGVRL